MILHQSLYTGENWNNTDKYRKIYIYGGTILHTLCRMHFPILINWTSPFPTLGLLGGIFHFYSNSKGNFCLRTVENRIRPYILQRLIWFCTVCLCPTKRTLDLDGLNTHLYLKGECDVYQQFISNVKQNKGRAVVECLIRDRRAACFSLTAVTALWSLSKTHLS